MKIALAMMVKDFTTAEPLLAFLKNARAYGHTIDLVLLGWQNSCTYGLDCEKSAAGWDWITGRLRIQRRVT